MLCNNCGKNDATIKFTQIINGNKTEMMVCEDCAEKMGITKMNFEMPIDISDFLGDFMLDADTNFMPFNTITKELKCNKCGMKYEEFLGSGKLGCEECYSTFKNKIDTLFKKIQGTDRYIGRKANSDKNNKVREYKIDNELENLQQKLKEAIKEERYEDAAKIRDQIKKIGDV